MILLLQSLYRNSNSDSVNKGHKWYEEANKYAQSLAERYDTPFLSVCAIISAISPYTRWERNKIEAEKLLRYGEKASVTTFRRNKEKALEILSTGNVELLHKRNSGHKTWNFYNNIQMPSDPRFVTIDRWMLEALDMEVKDIYTRKRYFNLANSFIEAANAIGIIPNQLQATIWEDFRNKRKSALDF